MAAEKRFAATAKKRQQSRFQGDVAKSTGLSASLGSAAAFYCLWKVLQAFQLLEALIRKSFAPSTDFHSNHMLVSLTSALLVISTLSLIPLAVAGLIGGLSEVCQVGVHFLPGQVIRFTRLSVVDGFRRIFGLRQTSSGSYAPIGVPAEILRHLMYVLSLSLVTGGVMFSVFDELRYYDFQTFSQVFSFFEKVFSKLLLILSLVWIGFGIVEYLQSRRQRTIRLRMSREELVRELRETQGDPQLAGIRNQLHQELGMHQAAEQVRRAKAVVVN